MDDDTVIDEPNDVILIKDETSDEEINSDRDTLFDESTDEEIALKEQPIDNNNNFIHNDEGMCPSLSEEIRAFEQKVNGNQQLQETDSLSVTHTVNGLSMVQSVSEERGSFIETNIPYADPVFAGMCS